MTLSDDAHAQGGLFRTLGQVLLTVPAPDSAVEAVPDGARALLLQVHQTHFASEVVLMIPARGPVRRQLF